MNRHSQTSGGEQHEQQQDFAARLRALGLRVTPPRLLVLETLCAGGGHMTAETIMQRLAGRYPSINPATIYRTLDTLVSSGLVTQTDLGNSVSSFELVGDAPHHHLVCSRCGGAIEVEDALLASLREQLLRDYGFHADARHMAIFGLCSLCAHTRGDTPQNELPS